MAAHAIAAAALSPTIYRSHCRRRQCRAQHATNESKASCVGGCADLAMHGNRVAAMELRPVTITGTDYHISIAGTGCRAYHAAITNCGAYLAGTDFQISITGADYRARHATGTNCRAYLAGTGCRAYHAAGTNCGAYLAGTDFHISIAGTGCRAYRAAGTNFGAYLTGTVYRIYLAGTGCRAHHAAITGTGCRAHRIGPRACHAQSHPMVCGSSHPARNLRSGCSDCR